MISEDDKKIIIMYAKKYGLKKVILFGSSVERDDAQDIDIGVLGLAPELFFKFWAELDRSLSKPVDVIDLSEDCSFNRLIERDGVVIYNG